MKESVWLGMYSEDGGFNQVLYKWITDKAPTYTNWAAKEPAPKNGKCVSFHLKDSSSYQAGQWQMSSCSYLNGYFCKKPAVLTNKVTTTSSTAGCPPV